MRRYLLPFLLLIAAGALAQTPTSSVADAAKTKPPKKARHIITNDDIPSRPEPEPAPKPVPEAAKPGDAAPATAAEQAKPEAETAANSEESEAVKAAQKKLDDLKARLETVQQQIAETDKKIDSSTDDQVRDALTAARDGKTEFAAELTKQVAEAEKELESARNGGSKQAASANSTPEPAPASQQ